jgi:hypothetical protein
MISIDQFLDRMPSKQYNCFDFVKEVWAALVNEDVGIKLDKLVGDFASRKVTVSGVKGFKRLKFPQSPCFVVMQRFKLVPHVGIFLDGRILHLKESGVEFQPELVAKRYFQTIRYYR